MTIGFKDALNQQMMMNNQPGFSDNIAEAFTKAGSQNANGPAQQANNAFLSGIGAGFKGSADNRRQAKIDSYFQKAGEITAKAAELEAQMQMAQDYQLKTNEFARMNTPLIAEFASAVDQNDPRANLMFKILVKKASIIPGFENLEAEDWNPTGGYGLALNTQTGEYRKISADDIIGVIAPQAQQLYGDTWFEKFTPLNGGFAKNLKNQFNKQQQNQNLDMAYKEAGINNINAKTNSEKLNMQALQQQMNNPNPQLSDIDKFNLQETRKSNEGFLKDLQSEVSKKDPQTKITVLNRLEEILKSGEAGIGNTPKDKIARWVKKNYGTDANIQEAKMLQKYMFGDIKGVAGNPNAKEWEDLTSRLISGEQNINAALNVLNFEKQQSENLLNNYNNYRKAISETNNEIPYYDPRIDEKVSSFNIINNDQNNNISDEELGIKF